MKRPILYRPDGGMIAPPEARGLMDDHKKLLREMFQNFYETQVVLVGADGIHLPGQEPARNGNVVPIIFGRKNK